jgi:hypothetical protein
MKKMHRLLLLLLAVGTLSLSGCLHILEEVTIKNNGSGTYKMTLDMSEIKGMMDALSGMEGMESDSTAIAGGEGGMEEANPMSQMGDEISSVASTLEGVKGLSNVLEIKDTTNFQFGYAFDFEDVAALNRALKVINKEKYDSKSEEVFKFSGKSFERLATADLGEEIKKALSENEMEDEEGSMEMVKMFFSDMTYKQVYHFPDRQVKKSSNSLSELSDDDHTLTITIKPFDEEQAKQKVSVGTLVKLK